MNPYYHPEKLGLKVLAELEHSDGCYQYDTDMAWIHEETGKVYTAYDSGCSCPVPFEQYQTLEDLICIDSNESYDEYEKTVLNRSYSEASEVDKLQFLRKVWDTAGLKVQVKGDS